MIEIGISNLEKSFGVDKIFQNVTFDIKDKEKIGLVGKNGVGKTTLMKIIYGLEEASFGQVSKRKALKVGYLEQVYSFNDDMLTEDVLRLSFLNLYNIEDEMNTLQKTFDNLANDELDRAINKYSLLHDKYEAMGGYKIKEKSDKITIGLDISSSMLKSLFNTLSGGEKTRVVLGKILLENPDVLLLDEPSNHLDIKSVEWLEEYLKSYEGSALIVSHDRYFLDRVADKIVELSSDGASIYNGNYSKYVVQKELKFLKDLKDYENQQKKIKKMEDQIKRYRIWGEMRDSDKMYRRAKELEKRLEKIDEFKKPIKDKKIKSFALGASGRTGKIVLDIKEASKSYGDNVLFKDADLTVFYKDSIAILGENGTGKSTLIKMVLNEISFDFGEIKLGSKLNIGYLPQEISFEDESLKIIDYFSYRYNITIGETRNELAKILFTDDDVFKKISNLSGGEKTRLKLLTLMYEKSNVLVLDEPTNHLDIDSRESLEEDLINYDGTIIFISHDRYFIDKVATRIAEIENKDIKVYNWDYEGYKLEKEKFINIKQDQENQRIEAEDAGKVSQSKEDYLKKKEDIKRIEKKKRDLKKLENDIITLEDKIKEHENLLYNKNLEINLDEEYKIGIELRSKLDCMYKQLDEMCKDEEIVM
jgi:ATPase subunit of ABC transporter with duplicated ATPase domains